jgi:hypothetical protein
MTQAIGMAPGLASLVMYIGSTDTAIISAMTTHSPLPTTIGCSWGWTPADPSTLDPYFEKMAAQGQNFFAASGDSSTWSASNEAWPADDANVVSVGGTDLVTASAAGPWKSETAWSDSGGGISPDKHRHPLVAAALGRDQLQQQGFHDPAQRPGRFGQRELHLLRLRRPNHLHGQRIRRHQLCHAHVGRLHCPGQPAVGCQRQPTIGFINPTIYAQNVTSSYATDFHDITSGTSGSYSAVTGYDLVTGWGSPNSGLINALTGTSDSGFSLSASPTSVSVVQGSSGTSTITSTVTGGFDSAVTLTASGQPTGVTVGFSPTSITGTGTSTMTMTVASTTATGTYTITVTGTSGSRPPSPAALTRRLP